MSVFPHVLSRKAVVVPVAAVLLAVTAFEGYGWHTRSQPVDYSRGGRFAAAATPSALPSSTPTALSPTGTPAPVATPAAVASGHPTVAPTRASSLATSQAAPVRTSAGGRALVLPAAGTYQLAVTGSEKVKFGPVGFCNQTLPSTTQLVVGKAASESATSYDFDIGYFPGKPGQHDERHIYRYTPAGSYLDYEIATVTCQGVRQSSETSFAPPALQAPLPLAVGAGWHSHGGGPHRTEDSDSVVRRAETLTIQGQPVPTYVIESTTSFTGDETGSRTQTLWYAPTWAMPVRWTDKQTGSRSGASYTGDLAVQVLSHP